MIGGYIGKILRVDLNSGKLSKHLWMKTLHESSLGKGLGLKLIHDDFKPNIDPLGLIISSSLLLDLRRAQLFQQVAGFM